MKYLKIFESKILDDILDKISADGEKNLTSWEREYLASFDDYHKRNQMEKDKRRSEKPVFVEDELDPDMYPNEDGTIDPVYDEYEDVKPFWDSIDVDDMNQFLELFKLPGDFGDTPWTNIPPAAKQVFKTYLRQKGYINK